MLHRATPNPAPEPGADAQSERRSDVRQQCYLETYCQPAASRPDDLWWLAMIQDVSQTGLAMLSTRRFEPDAMVTIELRGPSGQFICTSPARVVHIRKRSEGGWHIGCVFATRLSEHQLQVLISPAGADGDDGRAGIAEAGGTGDGPTDDSLWG
jgi:hypothetical protein